MQRTWLLAGAISGGLAVAAGAFGAHALEGREGLSERHLNAFKVGAQYQMNHALALVAVGLLPRRRAAAVAGWSFLTGTILFAGSLYLLALTQVGWWGAVTPIGGVLFLVGWSALITVGCRPIRNKSVQGQ